METDTLGLDMITIRLLFYIPQSPVIAVDFTQRSSLGNGVLHVSRKIWCEIQDAK